MNPNTWTERSDILPTVADEASTYGYIAEDRHMAQSFIEKKQPSETWRDGLSCLELIMAYYKSSETGRKLKYPPPDLKDYVPAPARTERSKEMILKGS